MTRAVNIYELQTSLSLCVAIRRVMGRGQNVDN